MPRGRRDRGPTADRGRRAATGDVAMPRWDTAYPIVSGASAAPAVVPALVPGLGAPPRSGVGGDATPLGLRGGGSRAGGGEGAAGPGRGDPGSGRRAAGAGAARGQMSASPRLAALAEGLVVVLIFGSTLALAKA